MGRVPTRSNRHESDASDGLPASDTGVPTGAALTAAIGGAVAHLNQFFSRRPEGVIGPVGDEAAEVREDEVGDRGSKETLKEMTTLVAEAIAARAQQMTSHGDGMMEVGLVRQQGTVSIAAALELVQHGRGSDEGQERGLLIAVPDAGHREGDAVAERDHHGRGTQQTLHGMMPADDGLSFQGADPTPTMLTPLLGQGARSLLGTLVDRHGQEAVPGNGDRDRPPQRRAPPPAP